MQNEKLNAPQMVREYKIGNTTYVVKSHSKSDATEDAVSKVRRLIRNDLRKNPQNRKRQQTVSRQRGIMIVRNALSV